MVRKLVFNIRYKLPKLTNLPGTDDGDLAALLSFLLPVTISLMIVSFTGTFTPLLVIAIIIGNSGSLLYHISVIYINKIEKRESFIGYIMGSLGLILIVLELENTQNYFYLLLIFIVVIQLLLSFAADYFYASFGEDRYEQKIAVGGKAPDFELENAEGQLISLADQIEAGKRTAILFVKGTWCPFCVKKLRSFNSFYADIKNYNTTVFAITTQLADKKIQEFASRHNLGFQFLRDKEAKVAKTYGILDLDTLDRDPEVALPATILIDENGIIQWLYVKDWALPSALIAELKRLELDE